MVENGVCPDSLASGLHIRSVSKPFSRSRVHPCWRHRMAEIRVEPRRRSLAWLWILLVLIIIGGLVYYYMYYR
jgi:hypothetical protein